MRGLAFPSNTASDRETSYEYGTPARNLDDIPIDPALGGPEIQQHGNSAAYPNDEQVNLILAYHSRQTRRRVSSIFGILFNSHFQAQTQFPAHEAEPTQQQSYLIAQQFSQAPQGDPLDPRPDYVPVEEPQPPPPSKPVRRKRKPRREEECSFCQGDDNKNKNGEPELMLTCHECGRSGEIQTIPIYGSSDLLFSRPSELYGAIRCRRWLVTVVSMEMHRMQELRNLQ